MMSVNERFYLRHRPPWWIFGILCGMVPLILIAVAMLSGQMIEWDGTAPLLIVCLAMIAVSVLSAMRRHRRTGSCFWEVPEQVLPDKHDS